MQRHVILNERGDIYIVVPVLNQVDGCDEDEHEGEHYWASHAFCISKLEIVIEYPWDYHTALVNVEYGEMLACQGLS